MASLAPDRQFLFDPFVVADPKAPSRHVFAWPGKLSPASIDSPQKSQGDAHGFLHSASGTSKDDAVLISSDEDSDYGDLDDNQSDTSFPPIEELLPGRHKDAGFNGIADGGLAAASCAGNDDNTEDLSIADSASPSGESPPGQRLHEFTPERSPVLSRPLSASPSPAEVEQDQPIPTSCALDGAGQAPPPDGAIRGNPAEDMSCAPLRAMAKLLPARHEAAESNSVASSRMDLESLSPDQSLSQHVQADGGRSVASGASDNDNAEEPTVDSTNLSHGSLRSQQLPACTPGCSTTSSPASAPPRPSSASPCPPQTKQGQPVSAGCASNEGGQAPPPQGTVSRASPPGVEVRQTPGLGPCLPPSLRRLEEATNRVGTPRRDSTSGSNGHSEAESGLRTATLRQSIRRFRHMPSTESDDEDEAEAVPKPPHRRRRQHAAARARGSETDSDNDNSDVGPPPPKRRKRNSPIQPTAPESATRRQIGLDGSASWSRRTRTRASDEKATSQPSVAGVPCSPDSGDDEGAGHAPMAEYEELALRDAVLKLITVNGRRTIQLEFGEFRAVEMSGSCKKHGRAQSPAIERPSAKRGKATKVVYTAEEDKFLIERRNEGLSWQEIHAEHEARFPHKRSIGTLQTHFSTKLR